jgi:NAD+ synthase
METMIEKRILNYEEVTEEIVNFLKDYVKNSGTKGFVIGVSGGIDSAVVSTLCARTGLPTLMLEMPIHQAQDQVTRARKHIDLITAKHKNTDSVVIDLTETFEAFKKSGVNIAGITPEQHEFSLSNSRSRLRMITLYQFAGQLGYIVAGTGNKVEDYGIGFFTKFGDGGVDISPIGDLVKSEVYELGRYLGVNEDILNAAPTDGLHNDGRTDEDQIGATYAELEWAMSVVDYTVNNFLNMYPISNDIKINFISDFNGFLGYAQTCFNHFFTMREKEVLQIYCQRHIANSHKMEMPPVITFDKFF